MIISITPVVNLSGINPGARVFDGPTLANIYLGKITEWDDPAIKKLNPNAKLPHEAISTVHRSDGSGTTFNFTAECDGYCRQENRFAYVLECAEIYDTLINDLSQRNPDSHRHIAILF